MYIIRAYVIQTVPIYDTVERKLKLPPDTSGKAKNNMCVACMYLERRARGVVRPVVRRREQRHGQLLRHHEDGGDAHVAQGVVPAQWRGPVDKVSEPADTTPLVEGGPLFV